MLKESKKRTATPYIENNLNLIRRIPYPYSAMLAICSDLDETPDENIYFEIARYLNTEEETSLGRGVGLEVGNSIYFDMPAGQFSYWNASKSGRARIRGLIKSGHIDCLHSFGDLATLRSHAERAIEELSRSNCSLRVWVDHGVAPSNFGGDIMRGQGDIMGSEVYHADISYEYGIRYVWRGRVTSVNGQETRRSLGGIWNYHQPVASAKTIIKEFTKGILGQMRYSKYEMHHPNRICRQAELRSGQRVVEFMRSNPHWGGIDSGTTGEGLKDILTDQILTTLMERCGISILYTHLGKIRNHREPFSQGMRKALNTLKLNARRGKVLVTTTRRLLDYCSMINAVSVSSNFMGSIFKIEMNYRGMENDLGGLSLYVGDPEKAKIFLNGREYSGFNKNDVDFTGRKSISIPWHELEFPRF